MTHLSSTRLLRQPRLILQGPRHQLTQRRTYVGPPPLRPDGPATYAPPAQQPQSRTGAYYKSFGSPVLKCFLGALLTYQLAYYAWLRLEMVEEKHGKDVQIAGLQGDLEEAMEEQRRKLVSKVGQTMAKVEEVKDEAVGKAKKSAWWPF